MQSKTINTFATAVVFLIIVLLCNCIPVNAVPQTTIKGYVFDNTGTPVSHATVIVYDRIAYEVAATALTDERGYFEVTVPRGTKYYVYVVQVKEGLPAYVPVVLSLDICEVEWVKVNFTLYPAAFVNATGIIYYIGGMWYGTLRAIVFKAPEGKPISEVLAAGQAYAKLPYEEKVVKLKPYVLDTYGTIGHVANLIRAEKVGVIPRKTFTTRLIVVPANVNIFVKIETRVLDRREITKPVPYTFTLGSPAEPLTLSEGSVTVLDLERESVKRLFDVIAGDIKYVDLLLQDFEKMRFYVAPERIELERARSLVEEARKVYESGGRLDDVLALLEKAYVIARHDIVRRLYFMKTVALEGASLLPFFIATFAAALALYFHEDLKKKVYSFIAFFVILMILFVFSYPGFTLLWIHRQDLFLATTFAAFALVAFLIFILPRKIKEAELPGAFRKGAILAITFSIAKRYSRLKRTRTAITVFSLAALIWAFTVLASISSVYSVKIDKFTPAQEGELLLVKHVVDEKKLASLGYYSDYEWFKHREGVKSVAVRVYNNPEIDIEITLKYGKKMADVKAILGLSPVEDEVTHISRIITSGNFGELKQSKSVILPSEIAAKLGVDVGDEVTLILHFGKPEYHKLKVVGIFSEKALDEIKDFDGDTLKPKVLVKGSLVPANSTDIIIMNWNYLIQECLVKEEGGLSQVFEIYSIAVLGNAEKLRDIAREYVERKGEGYFVYVISGKEGYKVYFGEKVENILTRNIDFAVPIAVVSLNVVISMYSIVNERKREIFIFNAIGFNPMHIALLFLAESIVYGILGGGIGYISGLMTFRVLATLGRASNLIVREKLEWYWSIIMIIISVLVSMISSFKPALKAAMMYTPSKVVRVKLEEPERIKREERIMKVHTGKSYRLSTKVKEDEALIFFSYLYTRLKDLESGYRERAENVVEHELEEYADGKLVKKFTFRYVFLTEEGKKLITENEVVCTKEPKEKHYRIELWSKPAGAQEIPIHYLDRVAAVINDILKMWERERKTLLMSYKR